MSAFNEIFDKARLSHLYWVERIELCETGKQRLHLAKEIAELARNQNPRQCATEDDFPTPTWCRGKAVCGRVEQS